jgi:predicted transcriptional regulator
VKKANKAKTGSEAGEGARRREAMLCLSVLFHRYLATIYGDLSLDLVSLSLLNEIAQHNLEPLAPAGASGFPRDAGQMKQMRGCNAFSLSEATGVPRETVRRKVKQLVELGLIEPRNRKGLFITRRWMDRISRDEAAGLLDEFRRTAAQIGELVRD